MDKRLDSNFLASKADSLERLGNYMKADIKYTRAILKNPNNYILYPQRGFTLKMQDRYEETIPKYKISVQIKPNAPNIMSIYYDWMLSLNYLKRYDEGIRMCQKLISESPALRGGSYYNWGFMLSKMEQHEEALTYFSLSNSINESNVMNLNAWGIALRHLGRYDESFEKYARTIKLEPNNLNAHVNLGVALYHQQKYDEASTKFQEILGMGCKDSDIYYNIGLVLYQQGKIDEAREKFFEGAEREKDAKATKKYKDILKTQIGILNKRLTGEGIEDHGRKHVQGTINAMEEIVGLLENGKLQVN